MNHLCQAISESVENRGEEAVSFLQDLIRTPSPSCQEDEVAEAVAEKMRAVGFDPRRLSVGRAETLRKGLGPGRRLRRRLGLVEHLRSRK